MTALRGSAAECWFSSLEDAKIQIEAWRTDYNEHRPHMSLGHQTPAQFEADWQLSRTLLKMRMKNNAEITHYAIRSNPVR